MLENLEAGKGTSTSFQEGWQGPRGEKPQSLLTVDKIELAIQP